jgi:hypothetical protein
MRLPWHSGSFTAHHIGLTALHSAEQRIPALDEARQRQHEEAVLSTMTGAGGGGGASKQDEARLSELPLGGASSGSTPRPPPKAGRRAAASGGGPPGRHSSCVPCHHYALFPPPPRPSLCVVMLSVPRVSVCCADGALPHAPCTRSWLVCCLLLIHIQIMLARCLGQVRRATPVGGAAQAPPRITSPTPSL